jgi:Sec-independent protein translocase protein TatA
MADGGKSGGRTALLIVLAVIVLVIGTCLVLQVVNTTG